MPTGARFVALDGCRIIRPREAPGIVEITVSQGECRQVPTMVSGTLGICEKSGPDHAITANGRKLTFPRDAVSVRAPGTVWSSEAAPTGWVAINIAPAFLPDAGVSGSMAFLERGRHFDVGTDAAIAARLPRRRAARRQARSRSRRASPIRHTSLAGSVACTA